MSLLQIRCFLADSTLGRSAKWLRLMGFDAIYDSTPPDAYRLMARGAGKRLILTRSPGVYNHLAGKPALLISSKHPQIQIHQIIDELQIGWAEIRPFSRCAVCNAVLLLLAKTDATGHVPDYVLQHQLRFHQCPRCHRIFWPGSHSRRWLDMMRVWFEDSLKYQPPSSMGDPSDGVREYHKLFQEI